jgi:hypothetical protein
MTNDEMKPNRYLRWHKARRLVAKINNHLANGGHVGIGSYTRPTLYGPKCAGMFKATRTGAYVQRGKRFDCIDFSPIGFSQ